MPLDPLEVAGLRLVLDEQPVGELSYIAADALVRGIDSPLLREAAAASPADWYQSRDSFVAALDELGLATEVTEQDAVWRLIRNTAEMILDEEVGAHEGAHRIWRWSHRVEAEGDLRIFIGLASDLDDHPSLRQSLEGQIRRAAAELLARDTPRTWVLLQARVGHDWPLWNPNPRRVLKPSEVPCTKELIDLLRAWQLVYERHAVPAVPHGMSIFANQADAVASVETGRDLAEALQAQLGDDWHVEYYPEPTNPYRGFRVGN
jgi:hypothetical protein